ncbi:MAG: hypothetical protein LBG52_00975 [Candidatus Peribacteria bacterium]|nr:hypothetical protein [Candidatus Peribacteria bacterium]
MITKINKVKEALKHPASRNHIKQYLLKKDNRPWLIATGVGFLIPGPFGLGVITAFVITRWEKLFPESPEHLKSSKTKDY